MIASPDHQHAPMLFASLDAKKDVYLEKPLSKSLEQSRQMIDAVRKSKQVVQIGMQRRSAESIMKAKALVDDGVLGRITHVKPQWHWNIAKPLNNTPLPGKLDWTRFLGSAPKRELEPDAIPVLALFLGLLRRKHDRPGHAPDGCRRVVHEIRAAEVRHHAGLRREDGRRGAPGRVYGRVRIPDLHGDVDAQLQQLARERVVDHVPGRQSDDDPRRRRIRGYSEPWKKGATPAYEEKAPVPVETHIANFLDCMKSRHEPNCTVEIAAQAVAAPHLANLAFRAGKKMTLATDGGRAS